MIAVPCHKMWTLRTFKVGKRNNLHKPTDQLRFECVGLVSINKKLSKR